MTDLDEAEDREAAERAKLNEAMVVMSAENSVISIRVTELAEMHRSARARWSAAKGQLTRAMKRAAPRRSPPPASGSKPLTPSSITSAGLR